MKRHLTAGLIAASAVLLGAERTWAQGLGGARGAVAQRAAAARGGGGHGGGGHHAAAAQQAAAQRAAQQRATQQQATQRAAQQRATQQAAQRAAQQRATQQQAAQRAAASRQDASRQAAARQAAVRRSSGSLPTDLGSGSHLGTGGDRRPARHTTESVANSVQAARAAAVRSSFQGKDLFTKSWLEKRNDTCWQPGKWAPAYEALADRAAIYNYWQWMNWQALNDWTSWGEEPFDYDYGTNIVYQDDQVYQDGQPVASAEEYYQQAVSLAQGKSGGEKPEDEWSPLGVFGLIQGAQTNPSGVVQLAMNKAGIVRGNYYNPQADSTVQLRGTVDPKTQRVAVMSTAKTDVVYEMGLYNLTRDEATVLVHLGKDQTQQWLLVRIRPPEDQPAGGQVPAGLAEATVVVRVPADAEVWFSGYRTSQSGVERSFTTPPLESGEAYAYEVRARWTVDGQPMEQSRKAQVKAGGRTVVDFFQPAP